MRVTSPHTVGRRIVTSPSFNVMTLNVNPDCTIQQSTPRFLFAVNLPFSSILKRLGIIAPGTIDDPDL